jgi:NAD(P)-dependent dehydrogenase (short-subunit alcohol dehydrogenase family)
MLPGDRGDARRAGLPEEKGDARGDKRGGLTWISDSRKVNPTGKFGTPAEVANGVVFISSPVASRISGTNLVIDGALTVAV